MALTKAKDLSTVFSYIDRVMGTTGLASRNGMQYQQRYESQKTHRINKLVVAVFFAKKIFILYSIHRLILQNRLPPDPKAC